MDSSPDGACWGKYLLGTTPSDSSLSNGVGLAIIVTTCRVDRVGMSPYLTRNYVSETHARTAFSSLYYTGKEKMLVKKDFREALGY